MSPSFVVRKMNDEDIVAVAHVHASAFTRQTFSKEWIECNFKAFPKTQFFVAELEGDVAGFIYWSEKSGFRKEAVVELEQIAVHPNCQCKGIGTALIERSLPMVAEQIGKRGATVKHILVNTRTDNRAQKIYARTLGATPVAVIPAVFSADEVYMVARDVKISMPMPDQN
jgi:ribosomal protein S18 acetylase RimI-like enzyme